MHRAKLLSFSLGAALFCAAVTAPSAEPVKIRVGWVAPISNLPSILFLKDGLARENGKTYVMEPLHFASTPTMIPALAANEVEIATLSYSAFAAAIQNAGMTDLRVIADEFQDGVPGYYTNEMMVLKESPIRSVEDLKGKVLASNGAGGAVDMALRVMLRKHGLEDKRDLTMIEVSSPNQRAALAERKVDLITSATPFSQAPELRAIARTLFTQRDAVGTTQMILWAARADFIAKSRAALVDFLTDTIRARRFLTDPVNHDEVVKIAADFAKQPADNLKAWLFTKERDYYRDPDDLPNLDALQANIDMQQQLGFLKARFDVGPYADLSMVKEAGRAIQSSKGSEKP
jgi:NitT/TauT family transport system substrate-binding protein